MGLGCQPLLMKLRFLGDRSIRKSKWGLAGWVLWSIPAVGHWKVVSGGWIYMKPLVQRISILQTT